jgi:hypothetical protein
VPAAVVVKPMRYAARIAPLLLLAVLAGGCQSGTLSRGQQLYAAKQTYDTTLEAVNTMFRTGVITDPKTALAVEAVSDEVYAAIQDAEAQFAAGNDLGFDYVMARVRSTLDAFIRYRMKHEPVAPEERWTP